MTMQRLKRGDMSRLHPSKAAHTDVYQPAPITPVQSAKVNDNEVVELRSQVAALTNEKRVLTENLQKETEACKVAEAKEAQALQRAEAAEAAAKEVADVPPVVAVNSLKVTSVTQVRSKENTMRIDCIVEPTTGPLTETVAIYLTVEEGAKLQSKGDTPSDNADDDNDDAE